MMDKDYLISISSKSSNKVIVIGALDDVRDCAQEDEEVLLLLLEPLITETDNQSIIFGYLNKDSLGC